MIKKIKKNKGFVLLFAVTLAAVFLSIALGIASVSLKEVNFSTSAKNTNDAFFAADSGVEQALYNDNTIPNTYPSGIVTSFNISGLNNGGQGCAKVTVDKIPADQFSNDTTSITAYGYNTGGSSCNKPPNVVERVLQTNY
jgi:hypothetical protein